MAALILWYVYAHVCKLYPERTFSMSSRYSGEQSSGALQRNQACTTADLKNWFYIEFFLSKQAFVFPNILVTLSKVPGIKNYLN